MSTNENNDLGSLFRGTGGLGGLIPHVEALIFASDKPLTVAEITDLLNQSLDAEDDKIQPAQIETALDGIAEKYDSEFYPFEVRQSGGGWQFLTKKEYHKTVAQLNGEKFLKRLSGAALETLAIIAYKQPITKGEIESIRGVSSDYSVQKLLEKELIIISGRNERLPGHPLVYATSKSFMDYFGINSSEDLPKIREVLAEGFTAPTVVGVAEAEQSEILSVSDAGELVAAELDDESTAIDEDAERNLTPAEGDTSQASLSSTDEEARDGEADQSLPDNASANKPETDREPDAV